MTTYLGIDVLEASPNTREELTDTQSRRISAHDPGLGRRSVVLQDDQPKLAKPYLWTCRSKAEVADLKDWLHVRAGQLVPFWLPSGRKDLLLVQDMTAVDGGALVAACGYTRQVFPSRARRHLAFLAPAGTAYRQVTAATDLGTQETLTLSAPLGFAFPRPAWICYLHLVRLASDDLEIVWHTDEVAECAFSCVEVPEEAP